MTWRIKTHRRQAHTLRESSSGHLGGNVFELRGDSSGSGARCSCARGSRAAYVPVLRDGWRYATRGSRPAHGR
eukprot:CAMPEP_0183342302 /NCGR_PEP_ID=MMETSP0164_2-20130417/8434_1 /TAXON_ID=221442 /ORGANISM="Coccolithus pelagicus ssp braarudi, Strain PLY182g" /LENGTH=72 /DNA_ID=CAMNT_0025512841 /DNA_START=138 /DNA_END=356 /DNA_ORIENTATION=-